MSELGSRIAPIATAYKRIHVEVKVCDMMNNVYMRDDSLEYAIYVRFLILVV